MISTIIFLVVGALVGLLAACIIIGAVSLIGELLAFIFGGIVSLFCDD